MDSVEMNEPANPFIATQWNCLPEQDSTNLGAMACRESRLRDGAGLMDIWATHLPALVACVLVTKGPVLEIGCGFYSTPILHELCKGRNLVTLEDNRHWIDLISPGYGSKEHSFIFSDYDRPLKALSGDHWGVVFIDNEPETSRTMQAGLFVDSSEFILIHDYDSPTIKPNADALKPLFPFYLVHSRFPHHTLILGNKEIPEIQ